MPAIPLPDLNKIHFRKAIFLECAVLNAAPDQVQQPLDAPFKVTSGFTTVFDTEKEDFSVELTIACQALDASGQLLPLNGRFCIRLTFTVDGMAEYLESIPGIPEPHPGDQLALTIVSLAYSTARGLILAKTADTVLQYFALPPLDVRNLVRKSSVTLSS